MFRCTLLRPISIVCIGVFYFVVVVAAVVVVVIVVQMENLSILENKKKLRNNNEWIENFNGTVHTIVIEYEDQCLLREWQGIFLL